MAVQYGKGRGVNALLREMQMLMGQGAAAPPAGTQILSATMLDPTTTTAANHVLAVPEAIQPGDQIVVACNYGGTLSSITFSDTAGSAYSVSPANSSVVGVQQAAIATIGAAIAAGALTVKALPNINASGQMVMFHLRGPALSINSANVQSLNGPAQPGTTPTTVGPYNASGPGLLIALPNINQSGTTTTMTLTGDTGYTEDIVGGGTYLTAVLHKLTTTAISGESFTFNSNKTSSARASWLYVPFT